MNYKKLIQILNFQPKENTKNVYFKKYINDYSIEIDFENNCFDFGSEIKAESKTTQNFSQAENWVVLECVDRLLEKNYLAKDITLEKTFPSGHGHSGRLDIFVEKEGKAFLMIECKTYGKEYEKELNNLNKNGGQLFTYFQNDTNAEYLMLYASSFIEEEVKTQQAIVKIEEHYRDAGNVVDVYERWNKIVLENGIFDSWVKPYVFQNKRITKENLIPLDKDASTSLFHSFLTILRKHSVSDKPNAFNVIFDLFLAKLSDETKEDDEEMEFQWLENKDDPVEFQYRLLKLYREGMDSFLDKQVIGLLAGDFGSLEEEKVNILRKKVLMLERVFNIKSVIDEDSFEENHRVLKEIVQLLQQYQIRYPKKQQHLSDFFERLLTTGLKQEAGQFFTPPPITRFIIKSLPVKQVLEEHINQRIPELPAVIDYAVGSGHFLTEIMEEYQTLINKMDTSNFKTDAKKKVDKWRIDEYDWASKYAYGIDKDYRLVKVAKVGCYFYGDGVAQVIHGDGLDNFEKSKAFKGLLKDNAKKPQFQFVLSNPPYSVSSFKTTLNGELAKKDFSLFDSLTDRSSEIECLFIERTKQLLKTDGITALVLPSSILSNTGIYTKTRAIILEAFDIVAITELGSNTFMATGTNTVVLFLKRREDGLIENIKKSLEKSIAEQKDNAIKGAKEQMIEQPIAKYIMHTWEEISFEDYLSIFTKDPTEAITTHEIFKEYEKITKKKKETDKWNFIISKELEKLSYFIIVYNQQVVLVKTGQKKAEKQFLGYEFSNRRGSEGMHPIQKDKTIDQCTRLYNVDDYEDTTKASTYIYKAFTENSFSEEIPEDLKENISYQNLVDMLTFDRAEFEKNISLSSKKKVKIESKWEQKKIGDISEELFAGGDLPKNKEYIQSEESNEKYQIPIFSNGIKNEGLYGYTNIARIEKPCLTISARGTIGFPVIRKESFYPIVRLLVLVPKKEICELKYLKYIIEKLDLNQFGIATPQLSVPQLSDFKIPLPPLEIQEKIVSEIEVLEKIEEKNNVEIKKLKTTIQEKISRISFKSEKLDNKIVEINSKTFDPRIKQNNNFIYVDIDSIGKGTGEIKYNKIIKGKEAPSRARRIVEKDSVIISTVRPYLKGFAYVSEYKENCIFSTGFAVLKGREDLMSKYLYFLFMFSKNLMAQIEKAMPKSSYPSINKSDIENFDIPLPPIQEQQKIVTEIEKIEQQIHILKEELVKIPMQKEVILKKYL